MGQGNFKGIINTIAALHADIIMLQEVNWGASIFNPMTAWQLKKVFEDLGYTYQLFGLATTSIYGAPFGNLLLSKYPLQQTYVKNFNTNELSHGEGRCYVHALVTLPKGKQLSVYDTHMDVFDVTGAVRLAQIKELTTQIASDKCPNVLLAADFNEVRIADYRGRKLLWDLLVHDNKLRNEPTPTAVASRLIDFYDCFTYAHQRVPTFSVWNGTTIDFMYVRKGWKLPVVGCYTYFSAASDHMPIVMDVLVK